MFEVPIGGRRGELGILKINCQDEAMTDISSLSSSSLLHFE